MRSILILLIGGSLLIPWAQACETPPAEVSPAEWLPVWDSLAPSEREEVFGHLKSKCAEAVPQLLGMLKNGTEDSRLLACKLLAGVETSGAEEVLCAAANDESRAVRVQALLSLRHAKSAAALATVRNRLQAVSSGPELKAALAALGGVGKSEDGDSLRTYLDHPDESVRVNAAAALAQGGDYTGETVLLGATESPEPQARRESTFALGYLQSEASEQRLLAIVNDPEGRWRTEAETALEMRALRALRSDEERAVALSALAESSNDGLARWAREKQAELGFQGPAPSTEKHATAVHGRGVLGDPDRNITANAFEVLQSRHYPLGAPAAVAKGTVDEDIGARPINHFYNPFTGRNTMPLQKETAIRRSARLWRAALAMTRRPTRDRLEAFKMLGRSMHMLQDMTSPAHVHDDPHIPGLDTDDFEFWGEFNYPVPDDIVPGLTVYRPTGTVELPGGRRVDANSPEGLVQGMAKFTYDLTAFDADIVAAAGAQPDSELGRMFPDGRLYYQDGGILGGNYWQIDDVGSYDPNGDSSWWPCDSDFAESDDGPEGAHRIRGRIYIENVSGDHDDLAPYAFERPLVHVKDLTDMKFLDIYAAELYPECVSRCAAYLKLFEEEADLEHRGFGCAASPTDSPRSVREASGDIGLLLGVAAALVGLGRRRRNRETTAPAARR